VISFLIYCFIEAKLWFFRRFLCRDKVDAFWFTGEIEAITTGRSREYVREKALQVLREEIERRGERMIEGGRE
jgi:hypothetical protein